jgi:hypothetical protein
MIIGLTGHRTGIGHAISSRLLSQGHDLRCFSRSNGYDILDDAAQDHIVKESDDADVFINNAYAGHGQSELLLKLWHNWNVKNVSKLIINIGSRAAVDFKQRQSPDLFPMHKLGLRELSNDLSSRPGRARISHLTLGYVDVQSVAYKKARKLHVDRVIDCIEFLLSCPQSMQVRELFVESM